MKRFIYKATNNFNGKIYIGQTKRFNRRITEHISDAENGYNDKFHSSLRKYGFDNFTFEIIEECEDYIANDRESFWITLYDSFKNGLNSTSGGQQSFEHSAETCIKISKSHIGVPLSENHREKISHSLCVSEKAKLQRTKLIDSKRNVPRSDEIRKKISETLRSNNEKRRLNEKNIP